MRSTGWKLAVVLAATAFATGAGAQTLTDALITAYRTSPLLESSRAGLRALDEQIPQARAERRPQLSATGSAGLARQQRFSDGSTRAYSAALEASLLLYDNGRTAAAIESARNSVAAGRADLKDVEQLVLLGAVEAYLDIRRDLEFLELARNDVRVLEEQLQAARDRFEVGEITRTDVSQTEARLANSRSLLSNALGQLEISRAAYLAAVGAPAGNLAPPPPIPDLPDSPEAANAIALQNNPQIISARFAERAAAYNVDRARAANGPSVQAEGSVGWENNPQTFERDNYSGEIGLGASVPLYTGGRNSSLVREALANLERRQYELQDTGRSVTEQTAAAWSQYQVSGDLIQARSEEVAAARIAAEGVREEARLGARSQLDVLDADLELLQAEADLVQAVRDEYVAAYNLLSAMGLLTVEHLNLGIETYDPDLYYMEVQNAPVGGARTDVLDRIRARWE